MNSSRAETMPAPNSLKSLLGANPFFAGLGEDAVEAIAGLCVRRSLAAEEVLFLKGDPGDALYAVRRGQIRIATGTRSGKRLTLNLLGPGDVFGEVALLDGRPRTADAVAVEQTELFMVWRRDFLDLLEGRPTVAIRFIEQGAPCAAARRVERGLRRRDQRIAGGACVFRRREPGEREPA